MAERVRSEGEGLPARGPDQGHQGRPHPEFGSEVNGPRTHNAPSISRAAAVALIEAVRAEPAVAGFDVATAVTDAGGHLVVFERTDGSPFLGAEVAIDKAWTAASFRL